MSWMAAEYLLCIYCKKTYCITYYNNLAGVFHAHIMNPVLGKK